MLGIYLHVPFCASKCPYCDFYSLVGTTDEDKDRYTAALIDRLTAWAATLQDTADTLYLGGGTPSLLGAHRLAAVITAARRAFAIPDTAEITLEANPGDDLTDVFAAFTAVGGNRLSLGVQAVKDAHLRTLGRRHTVAQVDHAVRLAQQNGIHNLSLDLMLGTSAQTEEDVRTAARRFAEWGATHASAYLLKIEPDTPYAVNPPALPDDDLAASLYLAAVDAFASNGFAQYEISNFAKPGFESRHNLKYWLSEPYLGIGPAAHSFIGGKRFCYPRSVTDFVNGGTPLAEDPNGTLFPEHSPAEFAMLRLRLTQGLTETDFKEHFGTPIPKEWRQNAAALPSHLVTADEHGIRLSPEGFLVSDAILARIL